MPGDSDIVIDLVEETPIVLEVVDETPIVIEIGESGPRGSDGLVTTVEAGNNITVDDADPAHPIVSADVPVQSVNGNIGDVVLDKTDVGLGNVDNTSDANKPISTAAQTALDTKLESVQAGTNVTVDNTDPLNPIISSSGGGGGSGGAVDSVNGQTGVVVLDAADVGADPTGTADSKVEDSIVDGHTTVAPSGNAVHDALALKQDTIGYTPENVANKDTDSTMAANSDTKYPSQKATKTALATKQPLDADLTAIAALDSSTSGAIASDGAGWIKKTHAQFKTALGLVKADVGLGNVDNTSDANKPVSTATQTALDAKVTGPASVTDDLPAIFDGTTGKLIKQKTYSAFKTLLALVKGDVGLGNVDNTSDANKPVSTAQQTALDLKQDLSEKAQANGYASLDSAGKVPVTQLPSSIMEYKGTWNATTNSPTLTDGSGDTGDVYRVSVAGSHNFGSGSISFDIGDYVIYNGTIWEKSDTTDAVATVFSRSGNVTAQSGDYNAGQVTNTPAGNIAATDVQSAINELDTEKQAALGFTAVPDTRTVNGHALSSDVTVTKSDVSLGNVTNDAQIKSADFPSTSVDSEVALFSSTTGKVIKRASATGIAKLASGVLSAVTAPTGAIVGTSDTQTLTNKTLTDPIISSISNTGTLTLPTATDTLIGRATTDTLTNKDLTSGTNTFPTFNQNTTGSAATLTTPRAIYGNNFDGSAALTQIIASTYGGTGNGFTKFSGPTTAEKTFTLPDANATLLYSGGALGTPSSATLTNATGLPVSGITSSTSTALGVGSLELGHASDTTIARVSAGVISVEGVTVPTISSTNTLTNKTISGSSNTISNIGNSSLTNSSLTIGSTSVSLGGTAATVAGLTLTNPTIPSFTNATHDHSNTAGGGTIAHSVLTGLTSGDPHTQYLETTGARSGDQLWTFSSTSSAKITLRGNSVGAGSPMVSRDPWAMGQFAETFPNTTSALSMVLATGGAGLSILNTDIFTTNGLYAPEGDFTATTNATVTTIATIATTSNKYYGITVTVIGRDITNSKMAMYKRMGAFRNTGGTLAQAGSTQTIGTDIEEIGTWDATLSTSGTNILVRVTGAASTNIKWYAITEVMSIS